ncbi:MAG: MMPL family transporter [Bacteroidota bacterium]
MDRLFAALRPAFRWLVRHPGLVLLAGLALAVAGVLGARTLKIDTDFANLLPDDNPTVQALERLRDTLGGESTVDLAVASPSFDANVAFAEAFIEEALTLRQPSGEPYLTRGELRTDTEFLDNNGLYFATEDELDDLTFFLEDEIEQARLDANPFFFDPLADDEFDDLAAEDEAAEDERATSLERLRVTEYRTSPDSTVLAFALYPSGSQTDGAYVENLYAKLDSLGAALGPTFHPEMTMTAAGRVLRQQVEIRAITDDVAASFGAGVSAVLLAVLLYFLYKGVQARTGGRFDAQVLLSELARLPATALVIAVPLLMSLAWTFGLASVVFGTLNLMTSTLGLVLFGLGIDYGIHFFARYTEERGAGRSVEDAAEETFVSTGQAIAVSALTTAAALYVLTIADFRGFSEFGFIGGTGILLALVTMLTMLPAMLALLEKLGALKLEARETNAAPEVVSSGKSFPAAKGIVIASFVAVVLAIVALPRVAFEYDFGALEPTYEAYEERAALLRAVSSRGDGRRNPAYVLTGDAGAVPQVVAAVEALVADSVAGADSLVLDVESLQERYPSSDEAAADRLARLAEIRALTDDPFLRQDTTGNIARIRQAASTTEAIPLDAVPADLRAQFTTKQGELGTFVLIYPSVGLSDARNSMAFGDAIGAITTEDGTSYRAASTSLVAAEMLRTMLAESPLMVGLTFLLIALLMFAVFRSPVWTLLALLPLVVGMLWMLGVMELTGVKLTFYNLVVLPAILGIGNDAGVHLVHRYREEGPGSIRRVLRSTGEHVAMGAVTTMIGFAGLLLSFHPGLRSIGVLAVIGILATLAAALIFLPALVQWREDRRGSERSADRTGDVEVGEGAP